MDLLGSLGALKQEYEQRLASESAALKEEVGKFIDEAKVSLAEARDELERRLQNRPTFAAPSAKWTTLKFGKWTFAPPDIIVHMGPVGIKLRQDHKQARGKDRGPRVFSGLDTKTVNVELHVITGKGEELIRKALESDLMPQKTPAARAYLPSTHPSLQATRLGYLACVEYEEELQQGVLVVKIKFDASETGATTQKGSHTTKAKDSTDVPVIEVNPRTGRTKDLSDFRHTPRPTASVK